MFVRSAGFIMVVALAVGLSAQASSVAGTWTVSVEAPPPHGGITASLALKQDGKKVTGTLRSDHTGDVAVEGEFVDRTLTLTMASPDGDASQATMFTAKLKDDGTLAGSISGPRGDMTWTAKRAKASQ